MPVLSTTAIDTRLSHLDCLASAGWLSFDVTHMGDPDTQILSPCCIHGYRAVYGPRPKQNWVPYTEKSPFGDPLSAEEIERKREEYARQGYNPLVRNGQVYRNMTEFIRGAQGSGRQEGEKWFLEQQRLGEEGSWVLVTGATQTGDAPPVDAEAKWWATTQSDVATIREEIVGGSDWQGVTLKSGKGTLGGLRRWTKSHRNATYAGDAAGVQYARGSGGVPDPGLGEMSALPRLGLKEGGIESAYWILYGNRPFLGISKCFDPVGSAQLRDTHDDHGQGSNWNGLGIPDSQIGGIIAPGQTADGGHSPEVVLFGGEVMGAQGVAVHDSAGNITGIELTDPGVSVISNINDESIEPPNITLNMLNYYKGFSATAEVTDDPTTIESFWPELYKTKEELEAELSDGIQDPIAQTFLVSKNHPDGMFVHSVDLCFQGKPPWAEYEVPVYVELRDVINGFPDANFNNPDAVVMLDRRDVKIAKGNPSGTSGGEVGVVRGENPLDVEAASQGVIDASRLPDFNDPDAYTRFIFKCPIYVEQGKEYAIVVRSNNSEYKLWVADSRQEPIISDASLEFFDDDSYDKPSGTYGKNYGGSLFQSQNGRTWSKDQWKDLMFRVNICQFGTKATVDTTHPKTGTVKFGVGRNLPRNFDYDRLQLNMFTKILPSADATEISADILVQRKSSAAGTLSSLTGTSSDIFGSDEEIRTRNMPERMKLYAGKLEGSESLQATFTLSTKNADISPQIDTRGCFVIPIQNKITDGGLKAENIKITSQGTGYTANPTKFTVSGGGSTKDATFMVATNGNLLHNTDDAITMLDDVVSATPVTESGRGFHYSDPELHPDDLIVVTQHSGTSAVTTPATFEILSEEGQSGGNSLTRYQTRPITLAPGMGARGIKVFLTALGTWGSDIHVYYKTLAQEDSEDIDRKKWKLMTQTAPDGHFFSGTTSTFDRNAGATVEYEFDTDEVTSYTTTTDDGEETYDTFRTFAVKIVLFASNPADPPVVKNLRAIALF